MISPTDGVKDRLAATDPWGDHQALAQAVREAAHQAFDREDVARWLKAEGPARAFRAFLASLPSTPRPRNLRAPGAADYAARALRRHTSPRRGPNSSTSTKTSVSVSTMAGPEARLA